MGLAFEVLTSDTSVSLDLTVAQAGVGGLDGLTPTVAIRKADTAPSPTPFYLDFDDGTFKTSGWGTKKAPLTGYGDGRYTRIVDMTALNSVAANDQLVAEYEVNESGNIGSDHDVITVREAVSTEVVEAQANIAYNDTTFVMTIAAWLDRDGVTVTSPTQASITLRDDANTIVFGPVVSNSPTPQGLFLFSQPSVTLGDERLYNLETSVTDAVGTYVTNQSLSTVEALTS